MRTRTTEAQDLKVGDRIAQRFDTYNERDEVVGTTVEISVVTRVEGPFGQDTGVGVYASREGDLPEGISRTWTLGASYWDEFDVII